MPHHAGYFVLAYCWDHHCERIHAACGQAFDRIARELGELAGERPTEMEPVLNSYKKWHYNNALYHATMAEVKGRQSVINAFGYRGYGVNRDLLEALKALEQRYEYLARVLSEQFFEKAKAAMALIYLPRELVEARNSEYVIIELCKKLGRDPKTNIPHANRTAELDLEHYFGTMSATSFEVNTIIFQKMFMSLGSSSMTIMKGSTGLHNGRSCQELKRAGNKNLVKMTHNVFHNLDRFTEINIDLLKEIHRVLSKNLHPDGGIFRSTDFPDRNGVTFDFGNFHREMAGFDSVLNETARSFHHLTVFLHNLARSYYLLIGIHPFHDCNGRVGRAFVNSQLLKKGLPPVSFEDDEEVRALPRYGGSVGDMHEYLKRRLQQAVNIYFYERWKLQSLGLQGKRIHNMAFDSGVYFRQIDDGKEKIGVSFEVYVVNNREGAFRALVDESRIVVPEDRLVGALCVYYGFNDGAFKEWRRSSRIGVNRYVKEIAPLNESVRVFDVELLVDLPPGPHPGRYFSCSVVCEEKGLVFNNKGLNYSYRIAQ